jgi:hypothetical protein
MVRINVITFASNSTIMNITPSTIEALKQEYQIFFYDNNVNEKEPKEATHLNIGFTADFSEYIGKTFKTPTKQEVTVEWVVEKLGANKVYVSFAPVFQSLLKKRGYGCFDVYPATYGIGVFVALSFKGSAKRDVEAVEELLGELGIEYKNEYSDAGWCYRFKISKSAENIEKIKQFIDSQ